MAPDPISGIERAIFVPHLPKTVLMSSLPVAEVDITVFVVPPTYALWLASHPLPSVVETVSAILEAMAE